MCNLLNQRRWGLGGIETCPLLSFSSTWWATAEERKPPLHLVPAGLYEYDLHLTEWGNLSTGHPVSVFSVSVTVCFIYLLLICQEFSGSIFYVVHMTYYIWHTWWHYCLATFSHAQVLTVLAVKQKPKKQCGAAIRKECSELDGPAAQDQNPSSERLEGQRTPITEKLNSSRAVSEK